MADDLPNETVDNILIALTEDEEQFIDQVLLNEEEFFLMLDVLSQWVAQLNSEDQNE